MHALLLLPGDGIGPEVMAEVERVIAFFNRRQIRFRTESALVGGADIVKDPNRGIKADLVLRKVAASLLSIPVETHSVRIDDSVRTD